MVFEQEHVLESLLKKKISKILKNKDLNQKRSILGLLNH